MSFDIDRFKSEALNFNGARPTLFEVNLTGWPGAEAGDPRELSFVARASSLPPSMLGQVDIPYFGRKIRLAGDRVYANWNITIMNDEDFKIRNALEEWHRQLNDHRSNLMGGSVNTNPESYKQNADVIQYSKTGSEIKRYRFVGIFPTSIEGISLDWEMTDQVEQFGVEFAVDYWVTNNFDDSGLSSDRVTTSFGTTISS